MPNEDKELLKEFQKLAAQNLINENILRIFKSLVELRKSGASLRDVIELLAAIIDKAKHREQPTTIEREAIAYICGHITGVKSLEELDAKLAFIGEDIFKKHEENDVLLTELIDKMNKSKSQLCKRIALWFCNSEGNKGSDLNAGILLEMVMNEDFMKAFVDIILAKENLGLEETLPGTSGRTGRGHI